MSTELAKSTGPIPLPTPASKRLPHRLDTLAIALDEFGQGLNRSQFDEVMLALFEHIPGLDALPQKRSQRYLQLLWLKCQQAILAKQHSH